jgi:hypothetical protein
MRTSNNEMLLVITLIGVMTLTGTAQASETVACNHKSCVVHKRQPSRKVYIT